MARRQGEPADVARFRDLGDRLRRSRRLQPNDWTPEEVECRIRDEDIEWAYVFDRASRQVLRKRGTADGVFFTGDELPLLKDAILIHNHPPLRKYGQTHPRYAGGSFSDRDVDLVLTYDVAEVWAVTPGWRYVMVRPLGGWLPDADSAVAVYAEEMERVRSHDREAIGSGQSSAQHAETTQAHRVMVRLAVWGRFAYRREER